MGCGPARRLGTHLEDSPPVDHHTPMVSKGAKMTEQGKAWPCAPTYWMAFGQHFFWQLLLNLVVLGMRACQRPTGTINAHSLHALHEQDLRALVNTQCAMGCDACRL